MDLSKKSWVKEKTQQTLFVKHSMKLLKLASRNKMKRCLMMRKTTMKMKKWNRMKM